MLVSSGRRPAADVMMIMKIMSDLLNFLISGDVLCKFVVNSEITFAVSSARQTQTASAALVLHCAASEMDERGEMCFIIALRPQADRPFFLSR
ncbi:jg19062 [Pararge aegeria aegeria]|uniref:Jg19062 protein n=1 Tax=Pararge aegeria aegeria TaxID=348720 RepID=A0A8S4SPL2_9NEOP|nr:jg19062 [Pararge aegeria aegeria]